jgi:DedD protein
MGLFSLFSSRNSRDAAGESSGRGNRARRSAVLDDDMLDPDLPHKQRARRRLIGAVVLMLLAVIFLPLLFESQPKPLNEDVAVVMPRAEPVRPRVSPPARQTDPNAPAAQGLDEGETVVPASNSATGQPARRPAAQESAKADATKAETATKSGKYIILIGAFSSEERAKNWQAKLRAAKIPNYIERKTFADGERNLLRAGPFNDHASALEAEKKVKAIGLTAIVREQ